MGEVAQILRILLLVRLAGVHLAPFVVAAKRLVVPVVDEPVVRAEDVDVLHRDGGVVPLREDRGAGGADRDVAVDGARHAAHDERVVAHVEPAVLGPEAAVPVRKAVRAHHRGKQLHVAECRVRRPAHEVEGARVDDLEAVERDVRRGDADDATRGVLRLVVAEDVAERVKYHAASVHPEALRHDLEARVEDGARREVDLLQVLRRFEEAVRARRVDPALDVEDARRALLRNLVRLLGRVREDGEDRLVGIVELDAEVDGAVQPHGDHAVPERALQAMPGREDLVGRHVARNADVHAHGRAGEGELAEAPVHVSAVRPAREDRLLAVVVDDERTPHALLLHLHRVRRVTRNRRRVFRIDHHPGGARLHAHAGDGGVPGVCTDVRSVREEASRHDASRQHGLKFHGPIIA